MPCSTSKEDNGTTAIVAFAVLGIFVVFVVLNVLRMRSFRTFDAERRRKSLHSTIKRIILSHLQMVSIVLGLSVPWPQLLKNVLNAVSSVASFSEGINSFECLYQDIDHSDFYNSILAFTAVGPLLFVGVIAIYWFGLVHCFGPLKCGSQIQSGVGAGPSQLREKGRDFAVLARTNAGMGWERRKTCITFYKASFVDFLSLLSPTRF